MTFDDDMAALGTTVGRLLVREERVPADQLDLATTGHACLIGLLVKLHHDVTGLSGYAAGHRSLHELERHPVALLGTLLRDPPMITRVSLGDALAEPRSSVQMLWADLARHATLAHHEWTTADPRSWPRRDAAWSVIADVAALAEGSAHLSGDLAASLSAAGRDDEAGQFLAAARSGLRLAAREVTTLALSGPTSATELVPKDPRLVVRVRSADDLPMALRRATALVRQAKYVSPLSVSRLGVAHARTMLSAADALERSCIGSTSLPELATSLREHAGLVAAAARPQRGVATIHPDDRAPLAQLSEIRQLLVAHGDEWPSAHGDDVDVLVRFSRAVPEMTAALRDLTARQIVSGRWLTQQPSGRWRRWPQADAAPDCVDRWWRASNSRIPSALDARQKRTDIARAGRMATQTAARSSVRTAMQESLSMRLGSKRPSRPGLAR